jgi:RNA polymerase sigma-70 factor (ECF subfamily)
MARDISLGARHGAGLTLVGGALEAAADGLRAGDPQSFRVVYDTLSPVVLGYLRAHGASDPEGMTQEVFLTLFRRAATFEGGEAALRTFVFSVAHARRVDELRQRVRRSEDTTYEVETDPRTSPAAVDTVEHRLGTEWVESALQQLPPAQRDVVALRVIAGLNLEETASAVGRSVGAVKQLQRRGLLALRDLAEQRGRNS